MSLTMKSRLALFILLNTVAFLFAGAAHIARAEVGYLAPGWGKQEFYLGNAFILKWCGRSGEKLIVELDSGLAIVDLLRNAIRRTDAKLIEGWSMSCTEDGRYALAEDNVGTKLYMTDTETLKTTVLHETKQKRSPIFPVWPLDSVYSRVSPRLTYVVGGPNAPDVVTLPNGHVIRVLKSNMLEPENKGPFGPIDIARAIWSEDERFFLWHDINESELTAYEPRTGKIYRRSIKIEGFFPLWLTPKPGVPDETYIFFISEDETYGKEYRFRFLDADAKPELVIPDLASYGLDAAALDGSFVFARNRYPKNKPGFEENPRLASPLAAEIYLSKNGCEQLITSLRPVNSYVLPLISRDGKRIAYIENATDDPDRMATKQRKLVVLRRSDDR